MDLENRNLSMVTDFYEITMANGYFEHGLGDKVAVFDLFFRRVPDNGGYALFAGLEQIIDYLQKLRFTDSDIEYLRTKGIFSENFLQYLRHFKFECDVWAVPEGTPVFPNEPVVVVRGPIIQAQFIETMLLLQINHQSLIATKAARLVRAAQGRAIAEFGTRRAQGVDAAVLGARASYIGGCAATACTIAGRSFGIPTAGTMAHSWIQSFPSEYEAFRTYAQLYPQACTLLVDTYNTLASGVPNAIRVFDEVLKPRNIRPLAIRLDSGDIAYLSKRARKLLDDAGYDDVKIMASNALDENIITDLLLQDCRVDMFGVGENLITSKTDPVFGGVYKLAALLENGEYMPKIKVSENPEKITTPHFKKLYRFYEKDTGKAIADYICLHTEFVDGRNELTIFDPNAIWKRKTIRDFEVRELLVPIFEKGKLVYQSPPLAEIRAYCARQLDTLWDEVKRFENPHRYYVDLSERLWNSKTQLISQYR